MGVTSLFTVALAALCVLGFVGGLVALGIFLAMNRKSGSAETPAPQPTTSASGKVVSPGIGQASRELEPATLKALQELITKNQVLNAIRLYREATGASLDEARAAIEALRDAQKD